MNFIEPFQRIDYGISILRIQRAWTKLYRSLKYVLYFYLALIIIAIIFLGFQAGFPLIRDTFDSSSNFMYNSRLVFYTASSFLVIGFLQALTVFPLVVLIIIIDNALHFVFEFFFQLLIFPSSRKLFESKKLLNLEYYRMYEKKILLMIYLPLLLSFTVLAAKYLFIDESIELLFISLKYYLIGSLFYILILLKYFQLIWLKKRKIKQSEKKEFIDCYLSNFAISENFKSMIYFLLFFGILGNPVFPAYVSSLDKIESASQNMFVEGYQKLYKRYETKIKASKRTYLLVQNIDTLKEEYEAGKPVSDTLMTEKLNSIGRRYIFFVAIVVGLFEILSILIFRIIKIQGYGRLLAEQFVKTIRSFVLIAALAFFIDKIYHVDIYNSLSLGGVLTLIATFVFVIEDSKTVLHERIVKSS